MRKKDVFLFLGNKGTVQMRSESLETYMRQSLSFLYDIPHAYIEKLITDMEYVLQGLTAQFPHPTHGRMY